MFYSATIVTQERTDTNSRNFAPVLRKKYFMQCMPQKCDDVNNHSVSDTKPEEVVSQFLDWIETRNQRLYPYFRGRPVHWAQCRHRSVSEIQDGGRPTGNGQISRSRLDVDAILTALLILLFQNSIPKPCNTFISTLYVNRTTSDVVRCRATLLAQYGDRQTGSILIFALSADRKHGYSFWNRVSI